METSSHGVGGFHAHAESRSQALSSADRLFEQLDHRVVDLHSDRWITEVTAIQVVGADAWVQLARADDPSSGVVLHLSTYATPDHALEALAAWSRIPADERPRVLDVPHLA
ncbi:MAG TPA: hypothetical protein VFP91_05370 [Vicinamibacterales bacterium]|nr:hypothetical protein [Vicinamibacterales bacterium]